MQYINDRMIKPVIIGGFIIGVLVFILRWIEGDRYYYILYILSGIITAHLLTQEYLSRDRDYLISGVLSGGVAGFVSWLLITVYYVLDAHVHERLPIYSSLMDFALFVIFLLIYSLTPLLLGVTFGTIGAILYRIVEGIIKNKKDGMAKAVLIGGVVGGVLLSIFTIGLLECYCLLCILPGVITAHLMTEEKGFNQTDKDYIISGGFSGCIAGLINWGLDTLIILIDGILSMANYRSPDEISMEIAIATDWLMMNIPLYILIGAISGSIGSILYKKVRSKIIIKK